ncbi:MAG: ABC transporter ATP-binding protein [Burkholderiales bacterium]|nr:ABC transporter ATP-binding protein [Burkholderiales bacterium]
MSILRTDQLTIAPGGQPLIQNLNWTVEPGELWCILGQNGVGKTSLLYALAGLIPPAAGRIWLDGVSLEEIGTETLAFKRGFMPQQQVDTFSSTVMAAVLIGRTPYRIGGSWDTEEDKAAAQRALEVVGMSHKAHMDVLTLSAGERQRVALATLLTQAPALMLLDEPAAHQDVSQQLAVMRLVRELTDKHAVISSCHDIDLAARFATHVLVLAEKHYWMGRADQVLTVDVLQQAFDCRFDLQEHQGIRSFIPY